MGWSVSSRKSGGEVDFAGEFMTASLSEMDPEIEGVLGRELQRQRDTLEMIASENFVPLSLIHI